MLLKIPLIAALFIAGVADESADAIFGECITKCFADLKEFSALVNFMETTVADQFLNIESMCSKKVDLNACVEKCDTSESEFHSRYLNFACEQQQLAEIKMHETCLTGQAAAINEICDTQCAGSIEDMHRKQQQLNASAMLIEDNFCKLKKCHLRCFTETAARSCYSSDADIGHFTKRWLKSTLQAIGKDIAEASPSIADQLCDFLSSSNDLFSEDVQFGAELSKKASSQFSNSLAVCSLFVSIFLAHLFHQ